jgi:hypothetical protein
MLLPGRRLQEAKRQLYGSQLQPSKTVRISRKEGVAQTIDRGRWKVGRHGELWQACEIRENPR